MTKQTPDAWANPFTDLAQTMEQFRFPGVDMAAIVESRRKDMEALLAANRESLESFQALIERQGEIFRSAMHSAHQTIESMVKDGTLIQDPARQGELARDAFQKAVAEMSALADMARKAQSDALAGITARVHQGVDEFRKLSQPR